MSRKAAAAERRAARRAKRGIWRPTIRAAGSGPTGLASVTVSSTLNCDVQTTVDVNPSFYGGDACGTFFEVDGTVYGPDSIPAGPSFGGLTPVSQTTTGSGTGADPYVITTVVNIGTTGITATETDTWVVGAGSFTTSVALDNTSGTAHSIHVYRAGDGYFADNDNCFGEIGGLEGLPPGAVACRDAWNPSATNPVPGNRMMEWIPLTPGNTYVEDNFSTVWQEIAAGGDLPNTCMCTSYIDDGMGLAWSGSLGAGATNTYNSSLVFNDNAPGSYPSPGEQGGGPNPSENPTTCNSGDPVNCATGNFFSQFTDFSIPGRGVYLSLQRSYSSAAASTDGPFGFGWTDSYNMSLTTDSSGDVIVHQEGGSTITFSPNGNGGLTAPPRVLATMVANTDGSYTLTRQQTQVKYNFSASGQLTSEVDRNGYVTQLAYSGGNLASVTDQAGRTLTFTYSGSHIASVTDPLGRPYSYSYDSSGNLTKVTDPLGRAYAFTYDGNHLLLTTTDPRGGVTSNTYDSQGRVVSQTDADGHTTTWAYSGDPTSSSGGTTTMTDPLGNQTVYTYVVLELMAVTRAAGTSAAATTSYTYDPATLGVATVADPNGNVTTNTYDSDGNLLTTTDSLGNTISYTYNSFNEILTKTSPLGETTSYTYDGSGNLLTVTDPLGAVTTYTYGDSSHPGDVTAITDPDGNVASYTYNGNGDVVTSSVSPSSGVTNTTAYVYDADGERTCQASPNATAAGVSCPPPGSPHVADTTSTTYDAGGEITSVTDPLGRTTSYAYDGDGNQVQITDALGHVTGFAYNGDNERTKTTRPDGGILSSTYDANGNLTSQTDAAGNTTSYTYDALSRVLSATDPLGNTTHYAYDAAGNRTSITNPSGQVTSHTYDQANELTGVSYSGGTTPAVTYSYTGDGQRASMTDGTGTTSYTYDADGRLTSVINGASATVSYGYDPAGLLTSITYPNGQKVTRSYDGARQLTSVSDWLGNTTRFSYDADGNLTSEAYPNGVSAVSGFDNADQLTSITDKTASATLASLTYTRNARGQVTSDTETGAVTNTQSYGYTQLSQLASDSTGQFTYDAAGNLTQLPGGISQAYNADGEITSATRPGAATPAVADQVVSANETTKVTKIVSPAVTTTSANELVLAFVTANGPATPLQQVTAVTGGGLTWSLAARSNGERGTAEVWQAHATAKLAAVKITATLADKGYNASITIATFTGAGSALGAHATAGAGSGAPAVSLTTTGADSLVWAAGEDSQHAAKRVPVTGQSVVHQYLDTVGPSTAWVQKQKAAVASPSTVVKIADTAPTADRWEYAAVEIPAAAVPPVQTSYAYDKQGNRTSISPSGQATTTLTYDLANRLTGYGTTDSYSYNGDGLRMSKTVSGVTSAFAWDQSGSLPLLLADGSADYIYGPDGQPIEQISGTTVTYLQGDQQHSTRLLTSSAGAVVGTYTYGPYGHLKSHTGTATTALQFDGQYTDAETGFQYLQARYYDPSTGQFLSQDPLVSATGEPYQYAAGSPLTFTDPSGLIPCDQLATLDSIAHDLGDLLGAFGDLAKGLKDRARVLSQLLRYGSTPAIRSYAGSLLREAGQLSNSGPVQVIRRFDPPWLGTAIGFAADLANGESVGRATLQAVGSYGLGSAGAAVGGIACGAESIATLGLGSLACPILVVGGGYVGQYLGNKLGGWAADLLHL